MKSARESAMFPQLLQSFRMRGNARRRFGAASFEKLSLTRFKCFRAARTAGRRENDKEFVAVSFFQALARSLS